MAEDIEHTATDALSGTRQHPIIEASPYRLGFLAPDYVQLSAEVIVYDFDTDDAGWGDDPDPATIGDRSAFTLVRTTYTLDLHPTFTVWVTESTIRTGSGGAEAPMFEYYVSEQDLDLDIDNDGDTDDEFLFGDSDDEGTLDPDDTELLCRILEHYPELLPDPDPARTDWLALAQANAKQFLRNSISRIEINLTVEDPSGGQGVPHQGNHHRQHDLTSVAYLPNASFTPEEDQLAADFLRDVWGEGPR
jgi:hypothetical protein